MSKLEQLRAMREARTKESRGSSTPRRKRVTANVESPGGSGRSEPLPGMRAGPREPKRRAGRPRLEETDKTIEAQKPWLMHKPKMSRATWYRRQKEK